MLLHTGSWKITTPTYELSAFKFVEDKKKILNPRTKFNIKHEKKK